MEGDKILVQGMLSLVLLTVAVFPLMYLWAITMHILFLIGALIMIALQVVAFMHFDARYMDTAYLKDNEKFR